MVHTATVEGKDPKKVVQRYLAAYQAAPHKTTGKSPLFNRRMVNKLTQLPSKVNKELDREVIQKHEKEEKQKYKDDT